MKRRHPLDSLDEDIRDHIERETEENIARGMSPGDARNAALKAFGSVAMAKEDTRAVWIPRWLDGITQDIRLALRSLRATPVVTAVAVLSLALGIGANTAIFSLVNSLVLRPLPVKDPGRLAVLDNGSWSYPIWEQIRQLTMFDGSFAWGARPLNVTDKDENVLVNAIWASGSMFDTLGVPALIGRTLMEDDDRRGGATTQTAVLSYAFWQRRFAGAPGIVGQTLMIERVPFTIVGITGPAFAGPDVGRSYDVAIPIAAEPLIHGAREAWLNDKSTWWLEVMVRLKPDQTIAQASAALRAAQHQVIQAAWGDPPLNFNLKVPFTLLDGSTGISNVRARYQRPLMVMLGVVALVLLIACANVANLLLARATARRKDWTVRLALGASRFRLVRLVLTESAVLAGLGVGAGVIFAQWGARYLLHEISPNASPVVLDLHIDGRVLAFTVTVATLTTLLAGTASAFRAAGYAPMESLKDAPRGGSIGGLMFFHAALVGQVAFSLVLLVVAGLFVQTFSALATKPRGFDDNPVLNVSITAPFTAVASDDRLATFERVRERVLQVPGVAAAGIARQQLLSGGWTRYGLKTISEQPLPAAGDQTVAVQEISPGWFSALGIAIANGRDLQARDMRGSPPIALVNEAFVRQFMNATDPVGQTLELTGLPSKQIVGVVGNVVYKALRDPLPATVYVPLLQSDVSGFRPPAQSVNLSVRVASGAPTTVSRSVAAAIADVSPRLALTFRPLSDIVDASLNQERVVAMLSAFFGGLALLLAALGLYGVTSYVVGRRKTELGIRLALGAQPLEVVRLVAVRVLVFVGIGVLGGVVSSYWASRFVGSLLFGLAPHDPTTLVTACLMLTIVGAVAAAIPAYRASRIDPAAVLRES